MTRRLSGRLDQLEERRELWEEEMVQIVIAAMKRALAGVLGDLNLTSEQQERARAATADHLLVLAAALRAENR